MTMVTIPEHDKNGMNSNTEVSSPLRRPCLQQATFSESSPISSWPRTPCDRSADTDFLRSPPRLRLECRESLKAAQTELISSIFRGRRDEPYATVLGESSTSDWNTMNPPSSPFVLATPDEVSAHTSDHSFELDGTHSVQNIETNLIGLGENSVVDRLEDTRFRPIVEDSRCRMRYEPIERPTNIFVKLRPRRSSHVMWLPC